ncbi:hypothetical protein TNCV_2468331 [Trichonephila clavipes]|nr:hypothetical protein TNCV_2468331 [Trichonephila clavipes]
MKTSSVEFISRSPNPSPMKSEHRRFVLAPKEFLSPGSGSEGEKRNRFEQTSRTLQEENIDAFNRKIKLYSPLVSMEIPLRTAYSQSWPLWHAAKSKTRLRAQAHQSKSRTETVKTETLEKNLELEREKEDARGARAGRLPSEYHRQTYL